MSDTNIYPVNIHIISYEINFSHKHFADEIHGIEIYMGFFQ
jgi:hypothetical protein